MKSIRILVLLCILGVLSAPIAHAQNGAFIIRDNDLFGWFEWNGENVLSLHSSDLEGFCYWPEVTDELWVDIMVLFRPDGTIKYKEKGFTYTRVFYPATPDDFFPDPCALWNSTDTLVAEGITHYNFNDNHLNAFSVPHKRRAVWGVTIAGGLYDTAGMCSSGMMDFNALRRWKLDKDFPDCLPDDCEPDLHRFKGPDIACSE
jgi:hypothetical protein